MIGNKKTVYLDIDDTVLDTDMFIRETLGGKWLEYNDIVYTGYDNMTDKELLKVVDIFSNYSNIPYKEGAKEGIKLLKERFNIIFCSSYHIESERLGKLRWSREWNIPIILCKGFSKDKVDMQGSIFVDDFSCNLIRSNAYTKICFYKKYHCDGYDGEIVYSWSELLNRLLLDKE